MRSAAIMVAVLVMMTSCVQTGNGSDSGSASARGSGGEPPSPSSAPPNTGLSDCPGSPSPGGGEPGDAVAWSASVAPEAHPMWPELADDTGAVIEVLDQLWGSVMTELGIDYISPRTLWHDFFEPESMTCGGLPAGVAWACVENADALIGREEAGEVIPFSEVDLTVNFDARVFLSALEGVDSPPEVGLPEGLKDAGDMIIWLVLAHEWGHAVQWHFELQGLPRLSSVDKARELQADCMSGGALGDGIRQELLIEEPGDQDEASASLYLVRDGLEDNGGDPHGSALERQSAFIDGWEDGLAACLFVPFTDVTPDDLAG